MTALTCGFVGACFVVTALGDRMAPFDFWTTALLASCWLLLAVIDLVTGPTPLLLIHSIQAAYWAHCAWTRRPPRRRKPSKVAGVVRNLGHRLTVAPIPAGAQ